MSTSPKSGQDQTSPVAIVHLTRRPWVGSLPSPLTPLIGREHQRALARQLVDGGIRLLTLHGPGGIGKTRLAIQVGTDLGGAFTDGVAWAPLATVRDPDAVIPGMLRALGIEGSPNQSAFTALKLALRDVRMLLILDNFEQVVAAGEQVAELLVSCPRLVAVVTSRTLLRVSGEHAIEVPPLDLPAPRAPESHGDPFGATAARLFVTRAQAVTPNLPLDDDAAAVVADICHRLEGIPLAIELAAARVNNLPLPALRSRLERRLPLLVDGPHDLPVRLRTMRNAIAWSYDLLSGAEQRLFRRMAVFPGGCRLDAIAEIQAEPGTGYKLPGEGGADHDLDTFARIAALTDHSLVRRVADPDGEPRYLMLETIREFGLEQLDAHGERGDAELAKATYLLALTEQMELARFLPDSEPWWDRLEPERANLRDALAWLCDAGERERALRLAGGLSSFWFARGHYRTGRHWLERALDDDGGENAPAWARALCGLAVIVGYQGDTPRAEALFMEGLTHWRSLGNALQVATALIGLGALAEHQGNFARATALLEEARLLAATLADPGLAAIVGSSALANLGVAAHGEGQFLLAISRHQEALAMRREAGHTEGVCQSLGDLGDVARDQGDYPQALDRYREVLALADIHRHPRSLSDALGGMARIAIAWRQPERAAKLLGAADALRSEIGASILLKFDRASRDYVVTTARASLGEDAYLDAREAGSALSLDDAIAETEAVAPPHDDPLHPKPATARYGLTAREVDVLRCVVERLTDREIAERLFISPRTVGWHVTGILTKLDVPSRRAAATKAIAEDLI